MAVVAGHVLDHRSVLVEIARSGTYSRPHEQTEPAQAMGLHQSQMMRAIRLPQAFAEAHAVIAAFATASAATPAPRAY